MTTIDLILTEANLNNHALVEASLGQLSHKTVQKARTGKRPLSKKMQVLVTEALNKALQPEKLYKKEDLFPTLLSDDL
jgi:hypothetical protein